MGKGRRFLQKSALRDLPEPQEGERVMQVVDTPGNSMLQLQDGDGRRVLCRIPNRFRNLIWVRKGDLVIASCDEEGGELAHTLYDRQLDHLLARGLIPEAFVEVAQQHTKSHHRAGHNNNNDEGNNDDNEGNEDDEEDDGLLFKNPNHQRPQDDSDSDSDSGGASESGSESE